MAKYDQEGYVVWPGGFAHMSLREAKKIAQQEANSTGRAHWVEGTSNLKRYGTFYPKRSNPMKKVTARDIQKAIPSKYIPAKIRRDPKTGKLKISIKPGYLKKTAKALKAVVTGRGRKKATRKRIARKRRQ